RPNRLAAWRAAVLREMGSDELAARAAEGGVGPYRRTLLEMARPLARGPAWSAGFTGGGIVTRLAALEHPLDGHPRSSRVAACAVFACATLCCVPLGRLVAERTPAFSELEGCLRKRYFVLAEIVKEDAANSVSKPR
ncbi:MAG: hypothetical protein HOP15_11295, partial [Planctomycetes bacterium]|nr:hypothetical protein [Planctomycetota bacterium]